MDAGVNELEFSTLRSMRSHQVLEDEGTNETANDLIQQSRSRQVSAQEAAAKLSSKADDVIHQDGIPREVLIAPPKPASDLELDTASMSHLQTLIKQSVENVGLQDRSWEDLLAPLPSEILSLINDQVIQQLARTKRALAKADLQVQIARAEVKACQDSKSNKTNKKEKKDDNKRFTIEDDANKVNDEKARKKQELAEQLDLEETARHILLEELAPEHIPASDTEQEGKSHLSDGLPKLTKFLVCVSEDVGSTRRLAFEANTYAGAPLFQNDDEDQEAQEKSIINEEVWHYIGGTIHLKAPEREWNRIEKILALVVYAACHLKLEMHLLRDSGCPRPPPLPEKEEVQEKPSVQREASDSTIHAGSPPLISSVPEALSPTLEEDSAMLSPIMSNSSDEMKPATKSHSKKWSRSNIVSLLFRDRTPTEPVNKLKKRLAGRLKMHRTRSITRKSEDISRSNTYPLSPIDEPLRMPGAFGNVDEWELVAPDKRIVVNMARTEEEQAGEILTAPASPTLSRAPDPPDLPDEVIESAILKAEDVQRPNERFKRVIERMQKAILSVSPDVHFPPPSLLQALREQEQQQQSTELTRIPGRPLLGRIRSYAGVTSQAMSPESSDGLPMSSSVPALLSSETAAPPTSLSTKISIDTRAGLASLMTGNNSLDGTMRHQSIPCLFEKLAPDSKAPSNLCQPPVWRKLVYYDYEHARNPWMLSPSPPSVSTINIGDVSLSDFCATLSSMETSSCTAECGKAWKEHAFSLIHMDQKISFSLKESLLASSAPENMLHWIVCSLCGKRSESVTMSEASLAISFGKYVELLLYDSAFHLPKVEFCTHSEDPFSLVRTFLRNGIEVRIKKEPVNLYSLRTPTSVDTSGAQEPNERVHREYSLEISKTSLMEEIRAFFDSIRESRSKLSNPFSETADGAKSEIEGLLVQIDITDLDSAEEELLEATETASDKDINDIRQRLIQACQKYSSKFDTLAKSKEILSANNLPHLRLHRPVYVEQDDIHVVPANNDVLLRESELSSFIAYTLSAEQYHTVFAAAQSPSTPNAGDTDVNSPATVNGSLTAAQTSSASISRVTTPSDEPAEDNKQRKGKQPDWELSAKFKKTVKPTGSILSLKATTPRARLQDTFTLSESNRPSRQSSPAPDLRTPSKIEEDDKVLEALLSATKASVAKPAPLGPHKGPALPSLISALVNRRHVSEAAATNAVSDASAVTSLDALDISVQHGRAESVRSISTVDSEASTSGHSSETSNDTLRGQESMTPEVVGGSPRQRAGPPNPVVAKGSAFSTISGFLNRGLRINHLEPPTPSPGGTSAAGPHIKLTFRHEHKQMSCIVYYAKQFADLRKACGLPESLYIKSLERSHALQFSGGKTSAGFWLTEDERLVLKEMRTSWNVSEVDAMLTFAPNYLSYLMNSDRPSLLTKIFGMYTCKIKNLKTGEKQKVDFVVMEHLFFDQQVTMKFDLKGISTRVARAKGEGQTLWDADWVENFQTRLLVHAHHKTILREAIAADTEFLQQNNVMDYSALVGVDDKNHTLTIGLIDTLGIFNLAKAIESNSKRVLQAERTIIPPDEYAARFQKALDEYIIASPEKFSKSPGDDEVPALHCPL